MRVLRNVDRSRGEIDFLPLSAAHRQHQVIILFILASLESRDTCKHLREVPLHVRDVLRITDDFKEVLISDEIETRVRRSLRFQVITERLLNLGKQITKALESLREA